MSKMEQSMEVDNDVPGIQSTGLPNTQLQVICTTLNLEEYIARYDGYTKTQRLLFIAEKCTNLQEDAYRLLINELKKGSNTGLYIKLYEQVGAGRISCAEFDREWVEAVERRESIKLERLEAELMAAKTTMVKESIRLSFNDIGDLHYERGNLNETMKSYLRTRDYCAIPKHTLDLCVRVVSVSLDLNQFGNVNFYATKAETAAADGTVNPKIKAASALVLLIEGHFKAAAKKFLEVGWGSGETFSTIIATEDIAVYGTLCALATLDRSDIRKGTVDNTAFKSFLELVPNIKDILNCFFAGKYGECLLYLDRIESELKLDIHLSKHVPSLISQITERLILLYFSPYSSVDMNRMATSLNMNIMQLEKSVAALIAFEKISARIDSRSKTLHRRQYDVRSVTIDKVERLSTKHLREIKRGILRLSVMQHGFQVPSKDSSSLLGGNPFTSMHPLVLSGREVFDLSHDNDGMNEDCMKRAGSGDYQTGVRDDDRMQLDGVGSSSGPNSASSSFSSRAAGCLSNSSNSRNYIESDDCAESDGEDDGENDD